MKNKSLVEDYMTRGGHRLEALALLMQRQSYPDVVREAQEIVELCLKALLRHSHIEVPRIHDVGDILREEKDRLPEELRPQVERLANISHSLRRDRELAFYGAEDLTPSEFYRHEDAAQALEDAKWVHAVCKNAIR